MALDPSSTPQSRNGGGPARPRMEVHGEPPSADEAAAIAAAIERFLRDTTSSSAPARGGAWLEAGLLEGAGLSLSEPALRAGRHPWMR